MTPAPIFLASQKNISEKSLLTYVLTKFFKNSTHASAPEEVNFP